MLPKNKMANTIREQVSRNLTELGPFQALRMPVKGWIRSIREALGMSGRQLAARMGVEPPRVTELEKAEVSGNLTLRSLQRAAEALDCNVVYAFVPKTSLDETLRRQALKTAQRRLAGVAHTMRLEDQSLSVRDESAMLQEQAEELMRTLPRWLWDDHDRV